MRMQAERVLLLAALVGGCGDPHQPSLPSPRILFLGIGLLQTPGPHVYVVHADGSGLVQLTDGPGVSNPFWSRDGAHIYFRQDTGAPPYLYVMDPDGSNAHPITSFPPGEGPGWSPDASHKAFPAYYSSAADSVFQLDLYVRNADSTEVLRIVHLGTDLCDGAFFDCPDVESAAWSPTGEWIAYSTFVSGRALAGYSDLTLVSPDGTQYRTLVSAGASAGAWSPDGQRLAFSGGSRDLRPEPSSIELVDVTGGTPTIVVDGIADNTSNVAPAWSADGTHLVFLRGPVGAVQSSAIFMVNPDGSGLRRVIEVPGGASAPQFNPHD